MYLGNLSKKEMDEILEDLKKEKNKNLLYMTLDLYNTTNFILVTDKSCAASGKLEDVFMLVNKLLNDLVGQCPEAKEVWVEYFRDIADQLENNKSIK